ncbi:ArsR/SmtB family transcription factor [Radiobacillus deserti]|uniref:Winged helix-turn-helix transcriptional regulator n=1 Tax=Radiobacillus deserti TaxID=2594883 RepID=A0A516KHL1_9BACI|nr:winged helix-turn-helix domain-containing protein [Radiobacillus deserti]QDP40875.1 winged helix-turn-helix transcriptional regulator [Radiobacillus deserti]
MEQKSILIIDSYEQLKAISDPLRTKMLMYLIEQPHTGHMLAEALNLSRAKILYHLRELEKHGIIRLVKKVEKKGNILKYYQAVAKGFIPADHLLNFTETSDSTRQSYLEVLDRAKTRVITAPDKSFEIQTSNVEKWNSLSMQTEFTVSKEKFLEFTKKYRELINTLKTDDSESEKRIYYLMSTAFEIEEKLFVNRD